MDCQANTSKAKDAVKSFNSIMEPIKAHLYALDQFLSLQVQSFEPELIELARYALRHKGKRIRPMLVFYSGWKNDNLVSDDLVKAAGIVELVHLATLVHDDILDDATLRHNSSTVCSKYGAKSAVLLGDAIFSHALMLASEFPTNVVCYEVAKSTRRVCAGETKQNFHSHQFSYSVEDYYRIIDLKTAELFSVSCSLGSYLAGFPDDYSNAVASFGRYLGAAYQIYDDLMDILGSEQDTGKTLGTDFSSGKQTLPLLLLLQKFTSGDRQNFLRQIQKGELGQNELKSNIEKFKITQEVAKAFYLQIQLASESIQNYKEYSAFSYLVDIKDLIVSYVDSRIGNL